MKRIIYKSIATILCVILAFGIAPLNGFVGVDLPSFTDLFVTKANAASYSCNDGYVNYSFDDQTNTLYINGNGTLGAYTSPAGVTTPSQTYYPWIKQESEGYITIEHVVIGKDFQTIGTSAFNSCSNLKTVVIEEGSGLSTVGMFAFYNCESLLEINIPASVTRFEQSAFGRTTVPKNGKVYYEGTLDQWAQINFGNEDTNGQPIACPLSALGNLYVANQLVTEAVFSNEISTINSAAFYGCTSFQNVVIPDTITSIGKRAFQNCSNIKTLKIGNGIEAVDEYTFSGCRDIINAEVGASVTTINNSAFESCASLQRISLPSSLTTVKAAFQENVSLDLVIYPGDETAWDSINITLSGNEDLFAARRFYSHWHDEHTQTYLKDFVQETCETPGYTGDRCCVICGWLFEKGEYREALGHNFETTTIEPTCTSNGFQFTACTRCGKSTINNIYSATGHECTSKIVRPTCTDGGYTLNVCNKCGLSTITDETDPLGHDYVPTVYEPTCTRDGYTLYQCSRCNASYIDNIIEATGHNYVDTEVQSTCTGTGYTSHKCSVCGDEYVTNETPAKGHSYEPVTVPATCTTDGYVIYICSACGAAYRGEQIPSPGHQYTDTVVAPTCTEGGHTVHTCSVCGNTYIDSETQALGHNYTETVVEATCQHGGYTRHECQNCHDIYDTDITPALEHNLEEAVVAATCTTGGFTINTCSDCGYTIITNRTNATGHNWQQKIFIQQTCIQDGYTISICENCGASSSTEGLPATGHSFGSWSTVENSTEEHEGLQQRHCQNCGYCEEKLLPIVNRTTFNVTFKADGRTVAVVEYVKGTRTIEEPAVPHKDRFTGKWENYTLNDEDITVNAIYTVIDIDTVDGVDYGESAVYDPETGIATINMYAASSGKTIISTSSEAVPLDIILVVDQSGSMDDKLGGVGMTKKQALINSANSFVNSVYDDAKQYDVNHRIAIVGFGMGKDGAGAEYPAYLNTEILTTGGAPVQMNNATAATYANALMPVNVNGALNSGITTAINNIDAKGATAADYGLSMANNIFANSTGSEGRQRVVVFMTDGAPTYQSSFSTTVANAAILQANELKTAYGATIYSVGTMDSAEASNTNISRFMNYVSSNYEDAKSLGGTATYKSSNYYYNVTNTSALSGVFSKIVTENITRTTDFDNITMINTVSKYFTMTAKQEKALRVSVIEDYGVKNSDITVTRNSDGTTTIIIRNLHPVDNGMQFVVDITFEVSASENANSAGVYPVGTDDSGIILGEAENYEFVFAVPHITVPADRKTAVFTVNGETYYIATVTGLNAPVAPETDFAGQYEFSGWNIDESEIADGYAVYDATLAQQEYVVIWNTAAGTNRVTYRPGDVIDVPDAGENSNGEAFRRWNGTVPVTMPDHCIEFTAVYGDHEHRYEAETITAMTCTQDGLVRYTCSVCGDTYDETIVCPGEHEWITATSESGEEESEQIIICKRCGVLEERMLQYSNLQTEANDRGHSEFIAQELNLVDNLGTCYQSDGSINISMPIDGDNQIFDMSVCRVGDNGEEIECDSDYENGVVSFDADHFSTYRFIPVYLCEITGNHIDANSDNYCDICDKKLIEEATVTFIVDSEVYSTGTYTVGSQTVIPESPQKDGCTFTGWTPEVAETVSSGETVYVAKWQAPEHTCIGTVIGARAATCSGAGYTGDTYCSICGELLGSGETIPASGHSYGNWSSWKKSDNTHESRYRVCTECGHHDVETRSTVSGGKSISLDKLIDYIFYKIFKPIFELFRVQYHGKYEWN